MLPSGAGNVLVPVDAAGRVLELLLVLEAAWAAQRPGYALALLSPVAFNALEFAKSQLEWMAEGLTHALESRKANPFALRWASLQSLPSTLQTLTYMLSPNARPLVLLQFAPQGSCTAERPTEIRTPMRVMHKASPACTDTPRAGQGINGVTHQWCLQCTALPHARRANLFHDI